MIVIDDFDDAAGQLDSITRGQGVDHVVDFVGQERLMNFAANRLRLGGKYCIGAGQSIQTLPISGQLMLEREISLLAVRGARRIDVLRVVDLFERDQIHLPIAARFPLAQAAEAHRFLEDSSQLGRVLLIP